MNLSPLWVEALEEQGYEATHWSQVGEPGAPDREILEWA
jgi:predicted nuclease of predicted toxin-antitoxin system